MPNLITFLAMRWCSCSTFPLSTESDPNIFHEQKLMSRLTGPITIISALRDISINKAPVCLPVYSSAGKNGVKSGITIIMKNICFANWCHILWRVTRFFLSIPKNAEKYYFLNLPWKNGPQPVLQIFFLLLNKTWSNIYLHIQYIWIESLSSICILVHL